MGGSLYLSGTPGTGKTATVHQALRELAADRSLPPFREIFVNGMKLTSPFEVYSILWEALTGQAVKPPRAVELLGRRFADPLTGGAAAKAPFGKQPKHKRKGVSKSGRVCARRARASRPRSRWPSPSPSRAGEREGHPGAR